MIQFSFLISEPCAKHVKLMCCIGTRWVQHREPDPEDWNNGSCQKFELEESKIPLILPVVIKFLPLLTNSISIAAGVYLLGPVRITEVNCVGQPYCLKPTFSPFP